MFWGCGMWAVNKEEFRRLGNASAENKMYTYISFHFK
jgi:hypothetical protein